MKLIQDYSDKVRMHYFQGWIPITTANQMMAWCEEQFGTGEHLDHNSRREFDHSTPWATFDSFGTQGNQMYVTWYVRADADAALFKIRWA